MQALLIIYTRTRRAARLYTKACTYPHSIRSHGDVRYAEPVRWKAKITNTYPDHTGNGSTIQNVPLERAVLGSLG